jgi:uncharacterized protein (DUF433 family)
MMDLIVIDPAVCNGRPVVKGTRTTVQTIMEFLAAGDSVDEVLEAYPNLTRDQVLASMEWASRLMRNHFKIAEDGLVVASSQAGVCACGSDRGVRVRAPIHEPGKVDRDISVNATVRKITGCGCMLDRDQQPGMHPSGPCVSASVAPNLRSTIPIIFPKFLP